MLLLLLLLSQLLGQYYICMQMRIGFFLGTKTHTSEYCGFRFLSVFVIIIYSVLFAFHIAFFLNLEDSKNDKMESKLG